MKQCPLCGLASAETKYVASFNKKCDRAFSLLSDTRWPRRIKACERGAEYGFALLLRFIQLEAALKVLRYWQRAKDRWPDRLCFFDARWTPLRDLKAENPARYAILIGAGGGSLREMRNRIAHEGHLFEKSEYAALAVVADWALAALRRRLPDKCEVREKVTRVQTRPVKSKKNLKCGKRRCGLGLH